MGRQLDWLPARPEKTNADLDVPFVQETPDVVRVLILQLARGAWSTLARLLQLACLTLDLRPLLAHEMASAGATGVVLDILCQAPRHHPAWRALSTAGSGLLGALVHCEGGTEAAQPQALRMLLSMLESDLTCGPARQAVATVLHCIVAQRTVHRDKLLAVGALPVLLRVLRRLDVLCDVVAVQELLWTIVYLTDEGALSMAGGGSPEVEGCQPQVAERLVPLLFLYGMPWHPHLAHVAALATRALHVHVAGYDVGKDTLRAAGVLSVLVDNVRRHSASYVAAAEAAARGPRRRRGDTTAVVAAASFVKGRDKHGHHRSKGQQQQQQQLHGKSAAEVPATRGSFTVGPARPPPHVGCDIHADGEALPNGAAETGPYMCSTASALGSWTPWQRLSAVLLISGFVPGIIPARRRRARGLGTADGCAGLTHGSHEGTGAAAGAHGGGGAAAAAGSRAGDVRDGDAGPLSSPSPIRSTASDDAGTRAAGSPWEMGQAEAPPAGGRPERQQWLLDEEEVDEAENDVCASTAAAAAGAAPLAGTDGAAAPTSMAEQRQEGRAVVTEAEVAVADGARLACYGLLLPLLVDAGEQTPLGAAGAAAAAVGGALLRRRLCPLREALATLKTLMCDCEANQMAVSELGLATLLLQLVAHGDMGLAWQAAEAAVYLSGGATGAALVAAGAAEEMAYLLEESADMLHGLTLRKQIQVRQNALTHRENPHGGGQHGGSAAAAAAATGRVPAPQATAASLSVSHGGAAAAPPPLTDVHVRPSRTASCAGARPQRLYLVGRVPLDFTTSSSCFYGSHDTMAYCDYCTPSAAIKVLLRLMAATSASAPSAPLGGSPFAAAAAVPPPVAAQEDEVCRRFAAAGGIYGVLLLLHHEAAGVHHSKLAASLLTLLDMLLVHAPGAQDELRMAGGLGVLTTLLGSLMRPGVMDVYQLRVATCRTLKLALQGNAANKLTAREHGLLPLLVSLLTVLVQQRKKAGEVLVVDDSGPLTSAILEALAAAAADSPGTQEVLVALGLLHPVCDLLRDERLDGEVRTDAVRTLTVVVDKYPTGQTGALALGAVPPAIAWLERCCLDAASTDAQAAVTGTGGGGPGVAAAAAVAAPSACLSELSETAEALAALLQALLRGGNPHVKSAIVSAGAVGILLQLLRNQVLAAALPQPEGAAAVEAGSAGGVTGLAASALAVLIDGDTDLQNELVSLGGLAVAADIVRAGGAAAPHALQLLSAMLRSNTFAKNTARGAGLPATLVETVRRCGLVRSAGAAAAATALAELAAGNHANQEAVAVQGGLEVAVDLLRDAFAALPLKALTGGGGAAAAASKDPDPDLEAVGRGSIDGQGDVTGSDDGNGSASSGQDAAAAAAAGAVSYTTAEAAQDAATVAALSKLLRALLGLVCACVELNGGNKTYLRELGGVSFLGQLLLATAGALTAPPPLSWLPYHQRSRRQCSEDQGQGSAVAPPTLTSTVGRFRQAVVSSRTAVSPAVAAACNALVAVTRESSANLARLEEQSGLAVALFKLLVASDAVTSLAAAFAIEWLVVRSRAKLDAPSREVFELNLVDVLALALYVPYAPLPLTPPAAGEEAEGAGASAADGDGAATSRGFVSWLMQQRQRQQQQGAWYVVVRALMPPDVLSAAAVRDAAAVLTAVADTADALDAQLQQQRRPSPNQQQQLQPQHPAQQQRHQQQGAAAVAGKSAATHGSLPALGTARPEPVNADHNTGLVVSDLLAGPSAAADAAAGAGGGGGGAATAAAAGSGSQAWWAELAGTAAPAFQRIANGALQGGANGTAAGSAAGLPSPAAVQAAGGAGAAGGGRGSGASAAAAGAGGGAAAATSAAVERRRQVAWMLFLLAAKSPENRARLRWLVRASLTPLAQQLANAEACRAQLESAAAAAPAQAPTGPNSGRGSTASGIAAGGMSGSSSAVLESASSLMGRLPVSTAAVEELGAVYRSSSLGAPAGRPSAPPPPPPRPGMPPAPAPPPPPPQPRQPQPPHPHSEPRQHMYSPQPLQGPSPHTPPLPPHPRPPSRPTSASSAAAASYGATAGTSPPVQIRAGSAGSGGVGMLYGVMYGAAAAQAAAPAATSTSVPATPREPYLTAANDAATASTAAVLRFTRLSRTTSGSALDLSSPGGGSAAAAAAGGAAGAGGAAASVSANTTPRISLTGPVAAAFAPADPALTHSGTAPGGASRGASLSPSRPRLYGGGAPEVTPAPAGSRALHAQISGGGSSVMSDDDELSMIQQEVALLANTTNALAWSGGLPTGATGMGALGPGRSGYGSGGTGGSGSPAATSSPLRWGAGWR